MQMLLMVAAVPLLLLQILLPLPMIAHAINSPASDVVPR